ncbi:hypothetical protein EVAR_7646_1 [Eumeta japonica]|uniref:Uncharacterized protein n=1 Tax=Eumeta variegata TaxID=151549 RepID=A0A4C1TKT6_EUMVA|nr:hypothetical protein EVAR_7646_1 [Eumeta japonica]
MKFVKIPAKKRVMSDLTEERRRDARNRFAGERGRGGCSGRGAPECRRTSIARRPHARHLDVAGAHLLNTNRRVDRFPGSRGRRDPRRPPLAPASK